MLRNLNRTSARGRILGTPYNGVLGSLIPSTGTYGPAYAYASVVARPGYQTKRYRGRITDWPSGLTFFAYEDTSFIASAPDGTYVLTWEFEEDSVVLGSTTITLTFGGSGTTITCTVGNAVADGATANISQGLVISAIVGNAVAIGLTANITVTNSVLISCAVGNAVASGRKAKIANPGVHSGGPQQYIFNTRRRGRR